MFLRIVKAAGGKGVQHEYVRLVESYRQGGKVKQRLIASLGRKELLLEHLDALNRLLRGEKPGPDQRGRPPRGGGAPGLGLGRLAGGRRLVARTRASNRSSTAAPRAGGARAWRWPTGYWRWSPTDWRRPGSEHGLAGWLETSFVCDPARSPMAARVARRGRTARQRHAQGAGRLPPAATLVSHLGPAVGAEADDRERAVPAPARPVLPQGRSGALRPHLHLFRRHGPARLGAHGYSRDGSRVSAKSWSGWSWSMAGRSPITCRRQRPRPSTVPSVLADLEQRFGLDRLVFVGDRGMITRDNLALLRAHGQGYILGRTGAAAPKWPATSPAPPGRGTNARSPSMALRRRIRPRPWCARSSATRPGHASWWCTRTSAWPSRRQSARRPWPSRPATRGPGPTRRPGPAQGGAQGRRRRRPHPGPQPRQRYWDWSYEDGVFRYFEHPLNFGARARRRGQVRHPVRRGEPGRRSISCASTRNSASRARLPKPQGRHRHAAHLPSDRRAGAGPHLRRRAGLPAATAPWRRSSRRPASSSRPPRPSAPSRPSRRRLSDLGERRKPSAALPPAASAQPESSPRLGSRTETRRPRQNKTKP